LPHHLHFLAVAAIVGSGVIAGLLFAFSLVVMRALRELAPEVGMAVMQRINVLIVNPLFLVLFLGSAALNVAMLVIGWRGLPGEAAFWFLLGGGAYLLGPLGVTVAFNVPLNNSLAATARERAPSAWPAYLSAWLRWNHVRTVLGVLATALLSWGLALAAQGR
jgi:uncharacterized membrane protein